MNAAIGRNKSGAIGRKKSARYASKSVENKSGCKRSFRKLKVTHKVW